MSEDRGKRIRPPVPHWHQQQNNDQNGVGRKEERNFTAGEAESPGNLCRQIIGGASEENLECDPAERSRILIPRPAHSTLSRISARRLTTPISRKQTAF